MPDDFKELMSDFVRTMTENARRQEERFEAQAKRNEEALAEIKKAQAETLDARHAAVAAVTGLSAANAGNQTNAPPVIPETSAVRESFKMPPLWETQPARWICQLENAFDDAHPRITSDMAKYQKFRGLLTERAINECWAVIEADDASLPNRYETLKAAVLKAFDLTPVQKHEKMFAIRQLGDRSVTSLVGQIRALEADPEQFFKAYVVHNFLPADVKSIIASVGSISSRSLDDIVEQADRVMQQRKTTPHVAAVTADAPSCDLDDFDAQYDALHAQHMEVLTVEARSSGQLLDPTLCRYHARWGKLARQCLSPCSWTPRARGRGNNYNKGSGGNSRANNMKKE
ncbi:uncharacterized protein LOC131891915, partial [Tigriopus californicus]|uniref:uncharacterized protein LOC131891915 n=1 Tax=Tigriopus californicus TaxID=6832 RepID=UPI0027DA802C